MSNNNIEIEAKVLLSEKDYEKLKKNFRYGKKIIQTNYYIDTPKRDLKLNNIALRIRHLNNEFTLTMKTPMSEGLLEKNETLDGSVALLMIDDNKFPKGDIHDFLELLDIDISKLKVLTKLITERIEIQYESGIVSLDKNTYNNIVDYELEVEDSSMSLAKHLTEEILNPLNIKFQFNTISKQSRAMSSLSSKK